MATRIRLRRMGAAKRPFYRVVVADQRSPRDGRFIEAIGKYHPLDDPSLIEIDDDRALHWLRVGAQPSNQVRTLMMRVGIWDRFVQERPSAAVPEKVRTGKPDRERLSKKAQAKAVESGGVDTGGDSGDAATAAPAPEPESAAEPPSTAGDADAEPAPEATAE